MASSFLLLLSLLSVARLASCHANVLFYPYGQNTLDNVDVLNDDGGSAVIPIPAFPFFGGFKDNMWVNTNGQLSFDKQIWEFTPFAYPHDAIEYSAISPYWADADTREAGQVYWRHTVDAAILARATADIKRYTTYSTFVANWVFVATWDDVSYYGQQNLEPRNTFQAVLITDGVVSFAMYNYCDIDWTTGTASGGDAGTGLDPVQAVVGYNAGHDGIGYMVLPESMTAAIVDIELMTNVCEPGRFLFQVDTQDFANIHCDPDCDN